MFKKLLSNLAFNPSLIGQLSFYAKRLHRETAFRRAGFFLISLTMVLQMFAVISPPQSSLQASPNTDIINGGFSSKQEAVNHCRKNTQNFKKIMNRFGIDCQDIASSTVTSIKPRDHNGRLHSMGRLSFGTAGEQPVNVPGVGRMYVRHFWSLNHDPSYKALKVKDSAGRTAYILFSCGNLVSIGVPTPPPAPKPEPKPVPPTTPQDVCPNKPGVQTNPQECDVCPDKPGTQLDESDCKPCEDSQTKNDLTACLEYSKKATNITQNLSDANGTTANPNDTIVYTLTTANNGEIDIKDYHVNEGLGDVLDYADVVDLHGGTIDEYKNVTWPKTTIKSKSSVENKITVKVKSEIPQTPASSSDSQHYNMMMTNVYGNVVEIKLPQNLTKTVELVTTTQLPNTGPGTSLIIGFSLTMIIGYFFARSRLLAKEMDIVRLDFNSAGGV